MTRWPPAPATRRTDRAGLLTLLWMLLLVEVALGMVVTILLSLAAGGEPSPIIGQGTRVEEVPTRFAAGGAFLFALGALAAAFGVRRWQPWSWTLAAVLQVVLAVGAGVAMLSSGETGATGIYLGAFGVAGAIMLLLSTPSVRRELGQA